MVAHGTPRLVFSSTAATYGEPEQVPIPEDAPTQPTNPYGASKLAIDHAIGSYARAHGLAATSLRYFNVAGAHGRVGERHAVETHLIPLVLQVATGQRGAPRSSATTGPRRTAPVSATTSTSTTWPPPTCSPWRSRPGEHAIYNLGSGTGFSVREVVEVCRTVTGHPSPSSRPPARRRPGRAGGLQRGGEGGPGLAPREDRPAHDRRRRLAVHPGASAGLSRSPRAGLPRRTGSATTRLTGVPRRPRRATRVRAAGGSGAGADTRAPVPAASPPPTPCAAAG